MAKVTVCTNCQATVPYSGRGRPSERCDACKALLRSCKVQGCTALIRYGRQVCTMHDKRMQATGEYGPATALRSYGTPDGRRPAKGQIGRCSVDGCVEPHKMNGLCGMHTARVRQTGQLGGPGRKIARKGEAVPVIDKNGYRLIHCGPEQGYRLEHRVLMEANLGRLLWADETVHHINGKRADNRLENLQLRQGAHGTGAAFTCADCGSHNVQAVRIADPLISRQGPLVG